MWLVAKKSLDGEDKIIKRIGKQFKDIDLEAESVTFEVMTWRKANAIHSWFVENVQDGNDDCKEYYVSWENLQGLLDTINNALGTDASIKEKIISSLSDRDEELAKKYLPIGTGFFFGSEEYDEWYFRDLEKTKEVLEKLLKNKELMGIDFYYSSSW